MGLMDAVKARIMSEAAEIMRGQNQGLITAVADLVHAPQSGGLPGLVKAFEDKGLGAVAATWVANGPNQPVTPEQIEKVLGPQVVAELARTLNVPPDQLKGLIAQFLPLLVDKLTPHGTLPPPPAPPAR